MMVWECLNGVIIGGMMESIGKVSGMAGEPWSMQKMVHGRVCGSMDNCKMENKVQILNIKIMIIIKQDKK